jgi:hypothetical protein
MRRVRAHIYWWPEEVRLLNILAHVIAYHYATLAGMLLQMGTRRSLTSCVDGLDCERSMNPGER